VTCHVEGPVEGKCDLLVEPATCFSKSNSSLVVESRAKPMYQADRLRPGSHESTNVAADMSVENRIFLEVTTSTAQIKRPGCHHWFHCLCSKERQALLSQYSGNLSAETHVNWPYVGALDSNRTHQIVVGAGTTKQGVL
jgi:hypothetical protein